MNMYVYIHIYAYFTKSEQVSVNVCIQAFVYKTVNLICFVRVSWAFCIYLGDGGGSSRQVDGSPKIVAVYMPFGQYTVPDK